MKAEKHDWSLSQQEKQKIRNAAWYASNREEALSDRRRRYATDEELREKIKARIRRSAPPRDVARYQSFLGRLKRHGITELRFRAMLLAQGNRCAICLGDKPGRKRGGYEDSLSWSIDHDHKTGAVRGLLCQSCNTALGHAKDDTVILGRMIDYLNKNKNGGAA